MRAALLLSSCASVFASSDDSTFPCGLPGKPLPPKSEVTDEEAEERRCCKTLPCKYEVGCWADAMPPLYSAPRYQALTRDEANRIRDEWLIPRSREMNKTHSSNTDPRLQMITHEWYRIPVPRGGAHDYFYTHIKQAFRDSFRRELVTPVDLDIFFVTDFDERWSDDETYVSDYPGAAYWIHNDCDNFRLCYGETGYDASEFTGNGVAFVLSVALPSTVNFRDGNEFMPAALELYNISHGELDSNGEKLVPPNREWMYAHRYNLGEIIWFNAFRWHSGHVPRTAEFAAAHTDGTKLRAETVGFAAEHVSGKWVLFRMCKGSTDDDVEEKIPGSFNAAVNNINPISGLKEL